MTIRDAFIRNKVNLEKHTMKQASSLKYDLEKLKILKDSNAIASLDIVDFYPSTSFEMIEKAAWHFAENLAES